MDRRVQIKLAVYLKSGSEICVAELSRLLYLYNVRLYVVVINVLS